MVALVRNAVIGLEEAAGLLGYETSGLRRIVENSRRKNRGLTVHGPTIRFLQPGKYAEIKFRQSWIDEFIDTYTVDPSRPQFVTRAVPSKQRRLAPVASSSHGLDASLIG
jgi:hypothetical protein